MTREQMVDFAAFVLRGYAPAREWGGVRGEAEILVDEWLDDTSAQAGGK